MARWCMVVSVYTILPVCGETFKACFESIVFVAKRYRVIVQLLQPYRVLITSDAAAVAAYVATAYAFAAALPPPMLLLIQRSSTC